MTGSLVSVPPLSSSEAEVVGEGGEAEAGAEEDGSDIGVALDRTDSNGIGGR